MSAFRLSGITLDEATLVRREPAIEQEREVAIHDLLEANSFTPQGSPGGPYHLHLGLREDRLMLDVRLEDGAPHAEVLLSLAPFKRPVRDYFLICESYYKAIREQPPAQIEALDMARRVLHDESSTLLQEKLAGRVAVDFDTARRLFTLICVLHLKG